MAKEITPKTLVDQGDLSGVDYLSCICHFLAWKTISKFTAHSVITEEDILEIHTYFASTNETLPKLFNYPGLAMEESVSEVTFRCIYTDCSSDMA